MAVGSARDRLLERDAEWARLASEGGAVDEILSYWTDDAIVIPAGMPAVIGKEALRAYVEGSLAIPGFRISWSSSDAEVAGDGTLGFVLSLNEDLNGRSRRSACDQPGACRDRVAARRRWRVALRR